MYKGSKPKIVPILIAVIIIALIVAALVSLGRMLFTGSTGTNQTTATSESDKIRTDLLDTSNGRAVRFTERGPIIADEQFKSYQIVVSPTTRSYTTYSGYLDRVISAKVYQNNDKAYEELVYALDKAYVYKVRDTQGNDDIRGVCATNGRVYLFETTNIDTATHTLWTSTCKGSLGNMGASLSQVKALFTNQVPDFDAGFIDRKLQTTNTTNTANKIQ